jgi:hypothetical protein
VDEKHFPLVIFMAYIAAVLHQPGIRAKYSMPLTLFLLGLFLIYKQPHYYRLKLRFLWNWQDSDAKPCSEAVADRSLVIMTGYRILAASYTDCITALLFDPIGPILKVTSEVKVGARPSWLTVHPNDPSLVFTGLEQREGVVVALKTATAL